MSDSDKDRNILGDLLADRATQGLSPSEQQQLARLLAGDPGEAWDVELTAATIQLAEIMPNEPLPANLKNKVANQAKSFFLHRQEEEKSEPARPAPSRPGFSWWSWAGWAVAAIILLAVVVRDYRGATKHPSLVELRQSLLSEPTTVRLEWTATKDPAAAGLAGDLVWNEREQRGYMRFRHLASNDAKALQYQLWIFAANQDEHFPVDGGVFDVPSGADDVIIPITPKIYVSSATLFAVTVEKPGGVVVSKRERIVSLAKVL